MKVAILMPLAEQRGGGELMLWHLMQQGRDSGIEWSVIFFETGPMVEQVRSLGVTTCVIPAAHLRQIHRFGPMVARISAAARRLGAQLIFSWMGKPHLYGCWAAKLAGVPSMWYQLGLPTSRNRFDRLIARLPASGILACSHAVEQAQAQLRPVHPMRVVHPGAELERFDPALLPTPAAARERLGLPSNGPLIGIVGRMQRWKGMHTLIEAMPDVLRTCPAAHCVIVGGPHALEPDYPSYLETRIRALDLADRVTLTGLQRNVPEWMQAMDVIVHASDREPFGIVVIEAMALNKPVIAGAGGGPTEVITDGVNGLLSPYGDAERLAEGIRRYLDDPAFAGRLAAAGRERAQDFSTRHYAQNLIRAVCELYPQ